MIRNRLVILLICTFALVSVAYAQTRDAGTPTSPAPTSAASTSAVSSTATAVSTTAAAAASTEPAATASPYWIAPPTQTASGPVSAQDIPLSTLGVNSFTLIDPRGSAQFRFTVPDNWAVTGNDSLTLSVQFFQDVVSGTNAPDRSSLYVYLDNQPLQLVSVMPNSNAVQQITVPLPLSLLSNSAQPTHTVLISMDALETCLNNINSHLYVDATQSKLHLEYQTSSPLLDLASFPRPFYNHEIGLLPQALMVMPDQASASDWETAASLAAGLGQMTNSQLQLQTVLAKDLTAQQRSSNNLIVIGQPSQNSLTASLYGNHLLPTSLDANQKLSLGGQPVAADSGVVQLIANPDNQKQAILVVTGQSETAVQKAAQALSDPELRLGQSGTLMVVSDVHPATVPASNAITDHATFADLGYTAQDLQVQGLGTSYLDIQFRLPYGYQAQADSSVEVYFTSAATLADSTSVVSLVMNDTPLQSTTLSTTNTDGTVSPAVVDASGRRVLKAFIPASSLIPGELNDLSIRVDVEGYWHCAPPSDNSLWFAASPDSFISIPRATSTQALDLRAVGQFPTPFTQSTNLSDDWFVLPTQPTAADFQQLIDFSRKLGVSTLSGATFSPRVSFGQLPADADPSAYNFIVLGLPSQNPFITQLNDHLPQPFIAGSDQIQQIVDPVVYQLPAQYNLGFVQILPSPWSADHTVLVITGITAAAQQNAAQILTGATILRSQMTGNVVYTRSTGIVTIDTEAQQRRQDANLTQQALLTQQPATQAAASTTPMPTSTAAPTLLEPNATAAVYSVQSIAALSTATDVEPSPTAYPTFAPLPASSFQVVQVEAPRWMTILIIVTAAVVVLTVLYGLIRLLRSRRSVV